MVSIVKIRKKVSEKRAAVVVAAVALSLSGCEFGGPYPDDVVASQAVNDATWATRGPITSGGKPYVLAVSADRDFAQIAPGGEGFAYSAADLEAAVASETGCSAVFQGGFLDRLDGFTRETNLRPTQEQMESFQRWRVDLSC